MEIRLPKDNERLTVLGMTGSGKTIAGLWHLSNRSYDKMPWIIFDFKGDETINDIPGAQYVDLDSKPPKKKGLYIVQPDVEDTDGVNSYLTSIWAQEKTGIMIDEGYMLEKSKAFERIMIQGRSKKVPAITLSQRPAWISRFAFSEADFHQVFMLSDMEDYKRVRQFVQWDFTKPLPRHHSIWYDVKVKQGVEFGPVPGPDEILQTFKERLVPKTIFI